MTNSSAFKFLLVAMSVVVLGLIAVQIYWFNSELELKKERLNLDAKAALESVSHHLEQIETVERLRSHKQARVFFVDGDTTVDDIESALADSLYNYYKVSEFKRNGENIEYSLIEKTGESQSTKSLSASSPELFSEQLAQVGSDLKFEHHDDVKGHYLDLESQGIPDSVLKKLMVNKTAIVGDVVKSLIEVNLTQTFEERVDNTVLDSLINKDLKERGLNLTYQYGVFDTRGNLCISSDENLSPKVMTSSLSTQLFPNDIISDPHELRIHFPSQSGYLFNSMWLILLTTALIIIATLITFYFSARTIFRQKQLAHVKNDFINNMTHELKTPISTISLACQALSDPDFNKNEQTRDRYLGMIADENQRLSAMVEEVLRSALFHQGQFQLNFEPTDAHQLVEEVVGSMGIQIEDKEGAIQTRLAAEKHELNIDKKHISNLVYNLLDNANKYSPDQPKITVATENENGSFVLSVTDNGIGISKQNLDRIFDRLYRVPTGNIHDVKGFGLGLSYVKVITEKHGGSVRAASKLGEGTTFKIVLPIESKQ